MKRNRRAGVEDRWTKTVRDSRRHHSAPSRAPNDGKRKAAGAQGMSTTMAVSTLKGFERKTYAQQWLDGVLTAQLATGTYVAPRAGRVTVAAISTPHGPQSQGHIAPKTASDAAQRMEQVRRTAVG